ncbi:8394_t:CDS:2 [Entrophospora sp. SA101]|nr:8394_t:CDS:2 [Entrophospora sp. SA101]
MHLNGGDSKNIMKHKQISIAPPSLLASPLELSNTINESIRTKNNNSIFDSIFDELGIPQNTDPLKWWAEKKNEFPLMSELALKYLCVSATSVPSERLFSDIGNQITKKRNNLSTDNNQNITHIQMSTTIQNIDQVSTDAKSSIPTWQDIEKAIVNIVKAGVYYKKEKDGKFMQNYKKRYTELHQAEDPDIYILNNAKRIYPNEDKYISMKSQYQEWYKNEPKILQAVLKLSDLYYQLAKNHFATNEEIEEEADDLAYTCFNFRASAGDIPINRVLVLSIFSRNIGRSFTQALQRSIGGNNNSTPS